MSSFVYEHVDVYIWIISTNLILKFYYIFFIFIRISAQNEYFANLFDMKLRYATGICTCTYKCAYICMYARCHIWHTLLYIPFMMFTGNYSLE